MEPANRAGLNGMQGTPEAKGNSQRPSWAGAALLLMAAFVASRLTGLLRDVVIAAHFGASSDYEAYLAGNRIPDVLFQVLAGGAVVSAFIPVLAGYLERRDSEGEWRLVATLLNLATIILVPIIIALMLLADPIMAWLTPGWAPEQRGLAAGLARVMLVSPLLFTLGCFVTSVLNAHHRFFLPALGPMAYNLGIIAGALWLADAAARAGYNRGYGLAAGATLGALAFLLVQVPGLKLVGMRYRPVVDLGMESVRQVGRLLAPRALGLGVAQINFLVVLFFASAVPGGYAALNYAWLLTMLPLGVFAIAISTAVFPTLARQTAADQMAEMRQTLTTSLRAILFLTIPASVGLVVLAEPVVRLLFERGQFDVAATQATAVALRFYAAALFAHATTEVTARAFFALQDTTTPFIAGAGGMLLNLGLCTTLVGPLAHGGLALAVSTAGVVEACALVLLVRRRIPGFGAEVLPLAGQAALGAAGMGAALLLGSVILPAPDGFVPLAIYVSLFVVAGGIVYLAVAVLSGCNEARRIIGAVRWS
jgi:putative peptidoglycan lipid II flippase